jgi:hypothetical protein
MGEEAKHLRSWVPNRRRLDCWQYAESCAARFLLYVDEQCGSLAGEDQREIRQLKVKGQMRTVIPDPL